jgi:DNA-binding transcriptional LysR family regulator
MDKLLALQYFVASAAAKSLSGAAAAQRVSVPAVARMVSAAADEQARSSVARLKGTLVVGVQEVIAKGCLQAALPLFHARYPDIDIDLRDFLSVTDEQVSGLDVMMMVGWPRTSDLVCRRVGESRFKVLAAPSYWAARGMPAHPSDLELHTCFNIRGNYGRVMDVWSFAKGEEHHEIVARGWLTTSNAHRALAQQLVLRGHGVGRFLDWADLPEVSAGALVPALVEWETPDAPPVNLLYSTSARRMPRARAFIDFVTAVYAELDRARGLVPAAVGPPLWMRRPNGRASDFLEHMGRPP